MSNEIHNYLPIEKWEYQFINNFGTYPFLFEDMPAREKFLKWMRLAQRYYIKANTEKKDVSRIIDMLNKLDIPPNSEDAQSVLAYVERAEAQINNISHFINLNDKCVLDFGSGHGMLSKPVLEHGASYYGLEYIQPVAIVRDYFLQHALSDHLTQIHTEKDNMLTKKLGSTEHGFDVIFCNNVLSEMAVNDMQEAITLVKKSLKPDGIVVIQDWLNPETKCNLLNFICQNFTIDTINTHQENVGKAFIFILKP